jgi:hypothetical protein
MENQKVSLKAKDQKKGETVSFTVGQANKLLKNPFSKWELEDKEWAWNGLELAKASQEEVKKEEVKEVGEPIKAEEPAKEIPEEQSKPQTAKNSKDIQKD